MGNKISRKNSLIFKMMAVLSIFLCAVFGISACTWFEDNATSGDSNYDANGNLRITSVNVALNKPLGNGSVDENTGSFVWDFEYYIDSTNKDWVDQYYDQLNYDLLYNELNEITNPNDVPSEEGEDVTVKKAIVAAKEAIRSNGNLFLSDNGSTRYGSENIYFHFPSYTVSISGITYQIKIEVNYSRLAVVMGKNGLFEVAGDYTAQDTFTVFYRIGTDGDWRTDYEMAKVVEITADESATANTATGTDDPYANSGSKFKIYFNPMLNKGSTNRYIRVQSIPSEQFNIANLHRGNSVYTSPVTFNVYKQTFKITCNNSSEYTYEGLTYDSSKYYFSTKEERATTTFSDKLTNSITGYKTTNTQTYSALTGYFVEGRVISVDRYIDTSSDYGFQAWTINGKADNSTTIKYATPNESGYPSDKSANACLNTYSLNSMGIKAVDYKNYIDAESDSSTAEESAFNIFGEITSAKPYYEILSKGNIASSTASSAVTTASPDYYKGTLYAGVCTNSASNVYYCNVAKVRNFILSGTLYDGENFFTSNTAALLDEVDIYIWQGDILLAKLSKGANNKISIDSLNDKELGKLFESMGIAIYSGNTVDIDKSCEQWQANISISNSQFSIGNLAYDCSISFGKLAPSTNGGDANNYSFYSTSMAESTNDGIYKLYVKNSDNEYSDRLGNTIIGTKYTADNKIEVNLYYENGNSITWAGNAQSSTAYNGVQYQVISTTQEETDVFGYTTSKVIISLLLPTNCSLTGYNVESINSICKVTYKYEDETILCDIGYNETTRKTNFTYYYVIENKLPKNDDIKSTLTNDDNGYEDFDANNVSGGNTLNCLMYGGQYYQYSHRDTREENNNTYYDYYYAYDYTRTEDGKQVVDRYVICRSEKKNGGTTDYTHYIYKNISNNITIDTKYNTENNKITVSSTLKYGGKSYNYDTQSDNSKVEVVATAYKTDLVYTYGEGEDDKYNMYVYYNIVDYTYKNASNNLTEYYYTAPIGIKTSKLSTSVGNDNSTYPEATTTITWFQSEFNGYLSSASNGYLYLSNKVYDSSISCRSLEEYNKDYEENENDALIMLGADIKAGKAGSNFLSATDGGKNIIANHYYYIKPVGEAVYSNNTITGYKSTELLISQYINTDSATITEKKTILLCQNQPFTGEYEKYITQCTYAFRDTNVSQDGDSYKTTIIEYGVAGSIKNNDNNVDVAGKVYVDNKETGYVHSMKDDYRMLFALENSEYIGYTLEDTLEDNRFINQEDNGEILQNITAKQVDGQTYYHISSRKSYKVKFSNKKDAQGVDQYLTVLYHIYTCYKKTDKVVSTYLYCDGTKFYIATSDDINLYGSPVLTPLENGKATIDGNEIKFINIDGNEIKFINGEKIYNDSSADYTNVVSYEYYQCNSNEIQLGTRYYSALGAKDSDNNTFSHKYSLTSKFTVQCITQNIEYYGVVDYKIENGKLFINLNGGDVEYDKSAYGSLYIYRGSAYTEVNYKIENGKLFIKSNGSFVEYSDSLYIKLNVKECEIETTNSKNTVVRRAVRKDDSNDVHLLGKVILLGNAEFDIYPSFSYHMENNDNGILHSANGDTNYYNVDYTTINNVIQGFPGVKILSGAPYVNPIMYFEVKHKADERAVIDIGLEITNGYYVEVIANAIDSTENNLIYDFSTVTFKDTITNLTSNDYINRMYYALDRDTQKAIIAYVKTSNGGYEEYLGGTPLTIQNIGINDNDPYAYAITTMTESGLYVNKLYYKGSNDTYEELKHENLIIWQSSTTALEDIPTFDAHNYYISDNGLIILTSDGQDNEVCSKLEDLFISGVGSVNSAYNYDEVLIGGFTSAYRVDAKEIKNKSSLQSFWKEGAINISNNYNFGDPYFLTDKEGVVLVANPIVSLKGDENGTDIIYAFKRWAVYGRYNSEILYYNQELSNGLADAKSAIMRFTSSTAGYYVFMPIYERIYSINVGTAINDGALNMGGSISVAYDNQTGSSINLKDSHYGEDAQNVYFVEMLKTSSNDVTQYYYSDIEITPFLYFTGTTKETDGVTYPVFEHREDIVQVKIGNGVFYYMVKDGKVTNIPVNKGETLGNTHCIIPVTTTESGGYYSFNYELAGKGKTKYTNVSYYKYFDFVQKSVNADGNTTYTYLDGTTPAGSIGELLCFGYSANYYFDGIDTSGRSKSKVVIYNPADYHFYAIENADFVSSNGESEDGNAWFAKLIGYKNTEAFATLVNKKFNSINKSYGDALASINANNAPADFVASNSSFHLSKLAGLSSGELYSYKETISSTDSDGKVTTEEVDVVYTTQQFKTSYFTRDTRMIISARADAGYRLYNWYLVEYNEKTQTWVKNSKPLSESITASYDGIIRDAYYNPLIGTNGTWYWKTKYSKSIESEDATGNTTTYYIYYTDDTCTTQATVPSNMLDDVRGYYVKVSGIWEPVYRKNSTSGEWYFDKSFTKPYSGDTSNIELKSHYECIRTLTSSNSIRYLLGDVEIYKYNDNYYRSMDLGNMVLENNCIYIYNLHNNLRIVAEFIEVYQSYVLTEEPAEDNIETVALYYTGTRSDKNGITLTDVTDKPVDGKDIKVVKDFEYIKNNDTIQGLDNEYIYTINSSSGSSSTKSGTKYVGFSNYENLIKWDSNTNGTLYKSLDSNGQSADIDLVHMKFDVGTTIYLVVKMHYDKELTIHSLGMNSEYTLTPVLYPTSDYISANMNASEDEREEHYFYIFQVTFNRDLTYYYSDNGANNYTYMTAEDKAHLEETVDKDSLTSTIYGGNYNPEYVIHVNRKKAIVSDVLNGNYTKYYSNLFNFYFDFDENLVNLEFRDNEVRIVGNSLKSLKNYLSSKDIDITDTSLSNLLDNCYHNNIKDLFTKLRDEYGININFAYVTDKTGKTYKTDKKLTTIDQIFNVISNKFVKTDRTDLKNIKNIKTAPLASGSINYINLASIPIYTYTTSIKILSNIDGDTVTFDEGDNSMEDVFDYLGVKLVQELYTRGGYYGHTYIGIGEKDPNSSKTITINGTSETYNNIFNNSDNTIGMFDQEYALAKDTIMVLGGIGEFGLNAEGDYGEKDEYEYLKENNGIWYVNIPIETTNEETKYVKYIFTGWYEQKKNSGENGSGESWSDYQFRSNDLTTPFSSAATADTNIIALFERAVDISFESDENAFTANFNSQKDSLGKAITTDSKDSKTTISGTFTISTLLSLDITPSGGYRLNKNWQFNNTEKDITNLNGLFTFGQYDDKNVIQNKDFDKLNLITTTQFNFVIGELLNQTTEKQLADSGTLASDESSESSGNSSGLSDEINAILSQHNRKNGKLSINLNLVPVKLTYILIEGYTKSDGDNRINAGYEFLLVTYNNGSVTPLVETSFSNGTISNSITDGNKDSAQRDIMLELNGNNLAIYGYFDYERYNGKLRVYTLGGNSVTLKAWYVNAYSEATSSIDDYPQYSKYSEVISGYNNSNYSFNIWYCYDSNFSSDYPEDNQPEDIERLTDKLNNTFFHLDENNEVYFLNAKIEAKSEMKVSYATIDSLSELNGSISLDNSRLINKGTKNTDETISGSMGSISWTGAYFIDSTSTTYIANGSMDLYGKDPTTYNFHGSTTVTLNNSTPFYDDNGKSYKFIGWFEYVNGKLSFVSETVTYTTTAGGHYVAIFAQYTQITDAYTTTINIENSKNLNGTIKVESADDKNIIQKKDQNINLEVYGTRNIENTNIMYVLVGGTISIDVEADKNYLVSDLIIIKGADKESIIDNKQKDMSPVSAYYKVDDTNTFEIVAQLSRGYSVNIVQLYYDSIAMSNTAIKIDNYNLISVSKLVDGEYINLSQSELYTFTTGTKIKIKFDLTKNKNYYNLGLIAYYSNGIKVAYTETTTPTIELTIENDLTLEVRTTKYVKASIKAYSLQTGNSISELGTSNFVGASYANQYNPENIIEVNNKDDLNNGFDVLNGTILTLKAKDNASYTFIEWRNEDIVLSSDSTYNYAVEYPYDVNNKTSNKINTVTVKGIFQGSRQLTINKEIGQIHIDDKKYQNDDGSYQDKLWSILDIKVEYTDASKNKNTTILGETKSKQFNVKANSKITLSLNINKSHENMYSAKFTIDGTTISDNNGTVTQTISKDSTITVTFYAKRNITLVRQINNAENNNNALSLAFGISSKTIESNPSLTHLGQNSRFTWSNIQYQGNDVFVQAQKRDGYSFAGFSINGKIVGKGIDYGDGYYYLAIDYTDEEHPNLSFDESGIPTLYTTDSDLVIVAMWYQTNTLDIKVTLDGDNILSDSALYEQLNDKLNITLVGNLLTYKEADKTYNTTVQPMQINNENYNKLSYLYNYNLALIASNYAGYQFVGFFYSTDGETYTKLDFNRQTGYNYGDTLASLLTLEKNITYTIEARYLTAWQVSTQISVTGDDKNVLYENSYYFHQVQFNKDKNNYEIVNATNGYDVYSGDNKKTNKYSQDYFYPIYSKYIAVSMDVADFMNSGKTNYISGSATPIGYYINGKYVDSDAIVKDNINFGVTNRNYIIIDLTKVDGFYSENDNLTKQSETGTGKVFGFSNMVIERKFVKNVDYIVRIGVNNTGDITKITQSNLDKVSITLTYYNPYSKTTETKTLTNEDKYGYWNTENNSLYYKIRLPIGTKVTTTISSDEIINNNTKCQLNGWYVYSNYSVAGSISVINHTNTVEFTLTDDTDIIAQYRITKADETIDTQFSYQFNGEAFVDGDGNNDGFYAPVIQGTATDVSVIAENLTQLLKQTKDFKATTTLTGLGGESIEISSEDGIIFTITRNKSGRNSESHKFMFMGWYQEIKDNKNPSTYLFVTDQLGLSYDDSMPAQMKNASNMTAIFSQIVEIELNFATDEDSNSINYSSLWQRYNIFVPSTVDYKNIGDYLYTQIEQDGTLVWHTLYGSNFSFNYQLANGYHNSNISTSDEPSENTFDKTEASKNVEQSAMEYIASKLNSDSSDMQKIHRTNYSYKFTSTDQNISEISSTYKCKVEDTTHNDKPAETTSTSATSLALVGEVEENVCTTSLSACSLDDSSMIVSLCDNSQTVNNSVVGLMGFDFEYDDTSSISSYIGAMVKGKKLDFNKIELIITIKFPDGTIKELKINGINGTGSDDYRCNYLYEIGEDGNYKTDEDGNYILTKLPIGTTIAITVQNLDSTRVLESITVYCVDDKGDFLSFNADSIFDEDKQIPLTTNTGNKDTDETSASASFEISNNNEGKINGKYLLFVINYKNIYNLELESNEISQGTVTIDYNNDNNLEFCKYETTISAVDDFAFDDIGIKFNVGTGVETTLKTILLKFLDGSYSLDTSNDNFINLKDLLSKLNTSTSTRDNYSLKYEDGHFVISYRNDGKVIFNIAIKPTLSSEDDLGRQYITSVALTFELLTNMKITTQYLHIATVQTNYAIEKFNPNIDSYISTEKNNDSYTLFIYDYEFSIESDSKYVFINQLDTLYKSKIGDLENKLNNKEWSFVGYYYSGEILKNSKSDGSHTKKVEPVTGNNFISDNLVIEAIYTENLSSKLGYDIDYFNNEIDYYEDGKSNPNLLQTPTDNLKFKNNGNDIDFTDGTMAIISTGLHQTSDIIIEDSKRYFSFSYWLVKYDNKYLAFRNDDGPLEYYKIKSSAICIGSNLYIELIKQLKASKDWNFESDDTFYQYKDSTDDSIDLSKFEIIAYLTEEVVEIDINYDNPGEQFKITFAGTDSNFGNYDWTTTVGENQENNRKYSPSKNGENDWKKSDSLINTTTWLYSDATQPSSFKIGEHYVNFLIKQVEKTEKDNGVSTSTQCLRLVYSKYWSEKNIKINIIATSYGDRSSNALARAESGIVVREILNKDGGYSNSTYLKLNGFKDMLGNVNVGTIDGSTNALVLSSNSNANHTASYWIDTTPLYLIEFGMAVYNQTADEDNDITLKITRGSTDVTLSGNVSLTTDDNNYAGWSLLFEEGTYVTIEVENKGKFEWADNPAESNPNYRGLAISHNLTMSDVYNKFTSYYKYDETNKKISTTGDTLSKITEAHKEHWCKVLEITTDDGQNNYYQTLNQYSNYYIEKSATSYSFIANQNASFIADYIGIFTIQNQYISAVLGSDNSIKYENTNSNQTSYSGENFIFTIAPNGTEISLKRTEADYYTEVENSTIIKDSYGNTVDEKTIINKANKKDEEETEDSSTAETSRSKKDGQIYGDDEQDKADSSQGNNSLSTNSLHTTTIGSDQTYTTMKFYSQSYHLSLGTVSNRYVSGNICVLYNYVTYNKQILKALSEHTQSKQFAYNLLNPNYSPQDDETEETTSDTDSDDNEQQNNNIPNAYIIKGSVSELKDEDLKTSISVAKNDKITLLAETFEGYSFVGFKLVSQSNKFIPVSETQGLQSNGSIYTVRDISNKFVDYTNTTKINSTSYYMQTISGLSGNVKVVALYQPKVYVLNITHKAFDSTTALDQTSDGYFKPNPISDSDTTYGKVTAPSLIVSSGDIVELKISTKGFAEYKGMTTTEDSYNAIYSTLASINNEDRSSISLGTISGNDKLWNAIGVSTQKNKVNETVTPGETKWTENETDQIWHYSSKGNVDISSGITYGNIHQNRLFTSEYSKIENASFAQNQNAVSYLYVYLDKVEKDVNLYAYFSSLYYTMNISIGEMQSALNKEDANKQLENSAYVAYSKEYQEYIASTKGKWTNPSADSQTKIQYGIADSDPYVYTFRDSNGNLLANPARVTENMLSSAGVESNSADNSPLTLDGGTPILTTVKNIDGEVTLVEDSTIARTFPENETVYFYSTCTKDYATTELKNLYNYLYISDGEYRFLEGLFSIKIGNDCTDSGSFNITTKAIYIGSDNSIIKIPNIKVAELVQMDVIINLKTSSIQIVLRVFADSNSGFPEVGISQTNKETDENLSETVSMSSARITNDKTNDKTNDASGINEGFSGTYFTDAYTVDENGNFVLNTDIYPDGLTLDAEIIFQIFAKKVTAQLNFGELGAQYYNYPKGKSSTNSNTGLIIDLTNTGDYDVLDALNECYHAIDSTLLTSENSNTKKLRSHFNGALPDGWTYCDDRNQKLNCTNQKLNCTKNSDECSMIDYYKMYIIKNAYTYVYALEQAVTNGNISPAYCSKFIAALLSFNPANQVEDDNIPMYGDIFDYINFSKYELQEVLKACEYTDLAQKLEIGDDLTFRQLDIYTNFKNRISSSLFMDNCVLYGDMVTTCVKLTEHSAPHLIQKDWFEGVWAEDPGYNYINSASAEWSYSQDGIDNRSGVGSITYDTGSTNNFYSLKTDVITQQESTSLQKVIRWLAGIGDNSAKYKDTYTKCIYSGIIPNRSNYTKTNSIAFTNRINIHLDATRLNVNNDDFTYGNGRIVTQRLKKCHSNLLSYILTSAVRIVIDAVAIGCATLTGGIGGVVIGVIVGIYNGYVTITDGIALLNGVPSAEMDPVYQWINELDFGFD